MINLNPPVAPMHQRHQSRYFGSLAFDNDLRCGRGVGAGGSEQSCDDLFVFGFELRSNAIGDPRHTLSHPTLNKNQ